MRLTNEDVVSILDTLVYDGNAEVEVMVGRGDRGSIDVGDGGVDTQRFYRVTQHIFKDTGFNKIPCGVCPVCCLCCMEASFAECAEVDRAFLLQWCNTCDAVLHNASDMPHNSSRCIIILR